MASGSMVHGETAHLSAQLVSRQVSGAYASCSRSLPVRHTRLRPRHLHPAHCSTASYQSTSATEGVKTAHMDIEKFLSTTPGGKALENLERADTAWKRLCDAKQMPFREVIRETSNPISDGAGLQHFDVVILGATLGIFLGATLARQGKRVAVVEQGRLRGRAQEWNISRTDMKVFVDHGLLTPEELEEVLVSEFNPVRMGFRGITEITTRDVLNCGVSPERLLDTVKQRFLDAGGALLEGAAFESAVVHPEAVRVELAVQEGGSREGLASGAGGAGARLETSFESNTPEKVVLTGSMLVDAMGAFSPIAAQARRGRKPDSVVLMVGSCSQGLPSRAGADLLYSFVPINKERQLQYFWEVFPAQDGITTYMFAYTDPTAGRASLKEMFQDYLDLLPEYQGLSSLEELTCVRPFFGFVPNWIDSPLRPVTSRLLHFGDSAGNRSQLSFAGFGAMARHLPRLTEGVVYALDHGTLSRSALSMLQPPSPAMDMTAAMQFTMGTRSNQDLASADPQVINEYLGSSFKHMARYGEKVYKPFMQDYLQASLLSKVIAGQIRNEPGQLVKMTMFMRSPRAGAMFAGSFGGIVLYDALYRLACLMNPVHEQLLRPFPALLFRWRCLLSQFKVGSANDYEEPATL